jgi:two-component system chemotaxis response regulator CheB
MDRPEIVVIGSSAGGFNALQELVAFLPADFTKPLFIVQHFASETINHLPEMLAHAGKRNVLYPANGTIIRPAHIYIAPPDYHMLIEGGQILVKKGPRENRCRPSIDVLFRSAAYAFGHGVIGIILTGRRDDGSSGMWSIKRMGGTTIVQDPLDAVHPAMPANVLQYVNIDYVVPLSKISAVLSEQTTKTAQKKLPDHNEVRLLKMEVDIAALGDAFNKGIQKMGEPSPLSCPECGGALTTISEGNFIRYRCHTGHAYTSDTFLDEVEEMAEKGLWQALRSLEEAVMILEKNAEKSIERVGGSNVINYSMKARQVRNKVSALRDFIIQQLQSD